MSRTSTFAGGPTPLFREDGWVSVCGAGGGSFLTTGETQLSPRQNTAAGFSSMPPSHVGCLAARDTNGIPAGAAAGMLGRQISVSPHNDTHRQFGCKEMSEMSQF